MNLTSLILDECDSFRWIPDVSCLSNLENLSFGECRNLFTINCSVRWWGPRHKDRSRVRFRNEGGSFVMGQSVKKSSVIFSIFPNISGKLSRLEQYERSRLSREVNFNGGKLLSSGQPSASKILSFSNKPTEWWILNKFRRSLNDKISKFERQDTSDISVKLSHSSKIKLVKFTSVCNVKGK